MSKELVIASNRHETKVAVLEDDQLVEVFFQRANEYSLAGSIHKGRVTRVLPGMQSAFVDLGLERDTFLYVSDFFEENEDVEPITEREERPVRQARPERSERPERAERPERGERPERIENPAAVQVERTAPVEVPATVAERFAPVQERIVDGEPRADRDRNRNDRSAPPAGGDRDRGRRSRRRRGRGQGFPDSKYAADPRHSSETEEAAEEAEVGIVETGEESTEEFLILPGESLSKYRGAKPAAPETSSPVVPDEPTSDPHEAPAEAAQSAAPEIADSLPPIPPTFPEPTPDPIAPLPPDPEPAEPEPPAPMEAHGVAEGANVPLPEIETKSEAELAVDRVFPAVGHSTPLVTADAAHDEALAYLADLEPNVRVESAEELEASPLLMDDEPASAGEAIDNAEPQSLTTYAESAELAAMGAEGEAAAGEQANGGPRSADVREGSGRYLQRSRRMRRNRGRGDRNVADRVESSPAAAPPLVEVAAVETRPARERDRDRDRERERPERSERAERTERSERDRPVTPSITELLKEGQEIIVQIAKEPLGQKGARITSHIALPGRYVVYMPTVEHLGVSRKIASDEERQRLKRILQTHRAGIPGGLILRTAGEGHTEEEIAADINFLFNLWMDIRQKAEKRPAPALLHHDLDIVQRILRDQLADDFKTIWLDSEEMYESILRFVQRFQPSLVGRVKLWTRQTPIFDAFGVTPELEKALRPKVWLKSGGYIVINQTEALVAIDINTGKYVGKSNRLEDTIVKTNLEAVKEIVRQIRLRDLGGIIVVDFIDMDERKNRQKVMQALEEAMLVDRAPYKILQFNDFGLVAITRKRVKQSLERTLCAPCPHCEGAGYVKSVATVIGEILQEGVKIRRSLDTKDVVLRVHPEVAKVFKSHENKYLEELEDLLGRPVMVKSDPLLHQEKFDLA